MTTEATLEDTLAAYSDDALAAISDEMRTEGRKLLAMADQAHFELTRRLIEREATHVETEHYSGVLKPGPIVHDVDGEKLMALREHVPPDVWERTYVQKPPPPPVWDQRQINELYKLGGEIKAIIDEARTSRRGDPRLELKRKVGGAQ